MQKLAEAIQEQASTIETGIYRPGTFDAVAVEWATHCLKTYQGKLLRRGLEISAAMVEYTCELEQREGAAPAGE